MRKKSIIVAAVAATLTLTASAAAIIGGGPDGEGHPWVGALLAPTAFSDGTWVECSGTLISPTVFLTAEHCDPGTNAPVRVTFASTYKNGVSKTYTGTWHGDPLYGTNGNGHPHDIAVVVFPAPGVQDIPPAKLPTLGQLDSLKGGAPIVSVGYGAQAVTKDKGKTLSYADIRYVATGSFTTLTQSYLKASMNPAHGDGGTCYGDSGGPNFIGDSNTIAATTITGDRWCRSTNVDYRLDTPDARTFLKDYVTLP